jgi:signal transduction histidine kinase
MALRQIDRDQLDAARNRLGAIVEQTDRLTEMLETFVDAARIGADRLVPLMPAPMTLAEVVATAVDRSRLLLAQPLDRGVTVTVAEACGGGTWDRLRVVRAVRALISNALVYGNPAEPVRVDAHRQADRVLLSIDGGGRGPDLAEAGRLFEPFFRGRSAAESGQSGSGLGLYTARGIARMHGGDVRYLGGDRFELELPVDP